MKLQRCTFNNNISLYNTYWSWNNAVFGIQCSQMNQQTAIFIEQFNGVLFKRRRRNRSLHHDHALAVTRTVTQHTLEHRMTWQCTELSTVTRSVSLSALIVSPTRDTCPNTGYPAWQKDFELRKRTGKYWCPKNASNLNSQHLFAL